jgi:hypothetical protein
VSSKKSWDMDSLQKGGDFVFSGKLALGQYYTEKEDEIKSHDISECTW